MTTFVSKYNNVAVIINTANVTEEMQDMDSAYDVICKYTEDIHTIKITASKEEEHIEIKFTNDDLSSTYLQEVKYTCQKDRVKELYDYFDELRDNTKVYKKGVGSVYNILAALFVLLSQSGRFLGIYAYIANIFILFIIVFAIYFTLDDRMISRILGEKQIQFWVSQTNIYEYEEKNINKQNIIKALYIISMIIFGLAIIVGGMAIFTFLR